MNLFKSLGLVAVSFVMSGGFACSPGELRVGTDGSGGQVGKTEDAGGGEDSGAGNEGAGAESGEDGTDPDEGPFEPGVPCLVDDSCNTNCSAGSPDCEFCEDASECGPFAPHCDSSLGRCVECLSEGDCKARFGEFFGACSAGRCVQCQTDKDCAGDVSCVAGWCGRCDGDWDCFEGLECSRSHCVPRKGDAD